MNEIGMASTQYEALIVGSINRDFIYRQAKWTIVTPVYAHLQSKWYI